MCKKWDFVLGYIFTLPGRLVTNEAIKMFLVLETFTYVRKLFFNYIFCFV